MYSLVCCIEAHKAPPKAAMAHAKGFFRATNTAFSHPQKFDRGTKKQTVGPTGDIGMHHGQGNLRVLGASLINSIRHTSYSSGTSKYS